MGPFGELVIKERIGKIVLEVREYYGGLNEVRMGARSKPPIKPDVLEVYEFLQKTGLRLVNSVALSDQPWLWMMIFSAVSVEKELQETLWLASQGKAPDATQAKSL